MSLVDFVRARKAINENRRVPLLVFRFNAYRVTLPVFCGSNSDKKRSRLDGGSNGLQDLARSVFYFKLEVRLIAPHEEIYRFAHLFFSCFPHSDFLQILPAELLGPWI